MTAISVVCYPSCYKFKTNYYSHTYKISKQKFDQIRKNAKQRNKMKKKNYMFFFQNHIHTFAVMSRSH